jgi:L-lactate dehydrogenase complex protein LldE
MKLQLMITCLGDVLRPATGQATVQLLRRLGHEVAFPRDQTCCGQPHFNSGFADLAAAQARHTIGVFSDPCPVIVPSGSCAAMVKLEYPHLLEKDSTWHPRAVELAAPLDRKDQCCGFGGSFSVRYPQISGAMVGDKVNCILKTEADAVVSTDAGCLMNIGGRLRRQEKPIEVLHLAELLERR